MKLFILLIKLKELLSYMVNTFTYNYYYRVIKIFYHDVLFIFSIL